MGLKDLLEHSAERTDSCASWELTPHVLGGRRAARAHTENLKATPGSLKKEP